MGLTKFWVSRSEDANAKTLSPTAKEAKSSKRSALKWSALFSSFRRASAARCTKPGASASPSSSPSSSATLSVSQAKLQSFSSSLSLCPSFVPLGAPCPVAAVSVPSASSVRFTSASVLAFERRLEAASLRFDMTSEGCGGAYFLRDTSSTSSAPIGIFKPRDEEYMAPSNPRGYVKDGAVVGVTEHPTNKGFIVGNGALRERAAYLLDEAYGNFSGVPVTTLLKLKANEGEEAKEGSVQAFVASESSAEDMGSLKFSVPEVHKVGILDVRLFNTDRHAGNILLRPRGPHEETYAMTPIDHGFCLPSYQHLDGALMDWMQWPQAQYPFTCEELDHIASLDIAQDAAILRSVGIDEECVTTMRICTALLQLGADAGFSLHEIGGYLQREGDFSQPSTLEKVVEEAVKAVAKETSASVTSIEFMDVVVAKVVGVIQRTLKDQPKKKVRSISCFS